MPQRDRPVMLFPRSSPASTPDRRIRTSPARRRAIEAGVTSLRSSSAALLERGQVDERLEHGSRLAARDDRAVIAATGYARPAADEREDFSGRRIDRDQRGFGLALALPPRQELIDVGQPVADGVLGQPLEMQVQRRMHVDGLIGGRRQARDTAGRASDPRNRRNAALRLRARAARRRAARVRCPFCRVARDVAGIDHRLEHDVAPIRHRVGLLNGDSADGD